MARIAFCLACAVLAACAAGPGRNPDDDPPGASGRLQALRPAGLLLAGFDSNGDYRIDPAELDAGIARAFAAADTDGSGAVSLIELGDFRARAFGGPEALPGPFIFDADQDGSVTAAEFDMALKETASDYAGADGAIPFSSLVTEYDDTQQRRRERALEQMARDAQLPY